MNCKHVLVSLLSIFTSLVLKAAPIPLVLWHAMGGHQGQQIKELVTAFNASQTQYHLIPVYKGNYIETLTSFAAAFRAKHPPDIVQIFEVGSALMLTPKGIIKPVAELMQEQGLRLPEDDFIPSVRHFYSRQGKLVAMPFNISAPILYYNADVLAKYGYSQSNFPSDWDGLERLAQQLQQKGFACAYTTAYPGWILFESYLAIHGLPITVNHPLRAVYDTPDLKRHFARMLRWHNQGYFRYAGRVDEATAFFTSGACPLFSQSSGALNSLQAVVPFHVGVAPLPLDTRTSSLRHANVIGGAALWAVAGLSSDQYQGVAQFFAFLARPEIQKRWYEHTGYLPVGLQGVYAEVFANSQEPVLLIAKRDLQLVKATRNYGPQNQIRAINDEVLEALFANVLNAKEAVRESVKRVNPVLSRFERNTI